MNEIFQTALMALSMSLCLAALIPVFRKWKISRIQFHKGLLVFLGVYVISYAFRMYFLLLPTINPNGNPMKFGEGLDPIRSLAIILMSAQLWFFFYGMNWRKLYSLPFLAGFFLIAGFYFVNSAISIILYGVVTSLITFPSLIRKGIKNRDGYIFAIGAFCLILFISYSFASNIALNLLLPSLGFFVLALGTYGWLDEKIFYDKVKEFQIKHTWLSTRIG